MSNPALQEYEPKFLIFQTDLTRTYRGLRGEGGESAIIKVPMEGHSAAQGEAMLEREYHLSGRLDSSWTLRPLQIQSTGMGAAFVYEDFGGMPLSEGGFPADIHSVLSLGVEIACIIGNLHSSGFIHGNIGPQTLWLNPVSRQLKLTGLGFAGRVDGGSPSLSEADRALECQWPYVSPEHTGRMGRIADYRSDFYSLGSLLYWMLTRETPLKAADPMEWMHAHMAKEPASLSALRAEIPEFVSGVVIKLLAKSPEDRYQSAYGISEDLKECLRRINSDPLRPEFIIGNKDVSSSLPPPGKIYGREEEMALLSGILEKARSGTGEVVLVSGPPGIGKSTLAREMRVAARQKSGFAVYGKFDEDGSDVPYSGFIAVFRDLIRQILISDPDQAEIWKRKVQTALGPLGKAIVPLIPEIGMLVGNQPDLPEVPPLEARNRMDLTFQNLVAVFSSGGNPLSIFLDDLQWADGSSLHLIEVLSLRKMEGLLIVLSSRESGVAEGAPFAGCLQAIREGGCLLTHVSLQPLPAEAIARYISDALKVEGKRVQALGRELSIKTAGNPLSLVECLKSLHSRGIVRFNSEAGEWQWDLEEIKSSGVMDYAASIMSGTIGTLDRRALAILQTASCIGSAFQLNLVSRMMDRTPFEIRQDLSAAVSSGLIFPVKPSQVANADPFAKDGAGVEFGFAHDRIREVCYKSIPEDEGRSLHWKLGRVLHELHEEGGGSRFLFEAVSHLNKAEGSAAAAGLWRWRVDLNLEAGRAAKISAAFDSSFRFLRTAMVLLRGNTDDIWVEEYDLTLRLTNEFAESAYLNAEYDEVERLFLAVDANARSAIDKVRVHEIKILSEMARDRKLEAVGVALRILTQLGVRFPARPNKLHAIIALIGTKRMLAGRTADDLLRLPRMSDPVNLAATVIFKTIYSVAYLAKPDLLPLIVFKHVQLSVKYGNTPHSCTTYSAYGIILAGLLGDFEKAQEFGRLSLSLMEKMQSRELRPRIAMSVYNFIFPWKTHIRDAMPRFLEGYAHGLETGDFEFAGYLTNVYAMAGFHSGMELSKLGSELAGYLEANHRMRQIRSLAFLFLYLESARGYFREDGGEPGSGYECDARMEATRLLREGKDRNLLFFDSLLKVIRCSYFHSYEEGARNAKEAGSHSESAFGVYAIAIFAFHGSLLALGGVSGSAAIRQALRGTRKRRNRLRNWARHAPANFAHKFHMVEAERCRLRGQNESATRHFESAVALARAGDYVQEEALASELAARHHFASGNERLGRFCLREAHIAYRRWGAVAKLRSLEARHAGNWIMLEGAAPSVSSPGMPTRKNSGATDLTSVLKASQAISSEIVLPRLLQNLMKVIIENAGAQRGALILGKKGGRLFVETEGNVDGFPMQPKSVPLENHADLPSAMIQYVASTGQHVVLSDASGDSDFARDPYISRVKPRSVLCAPLTYQGESRGILYLENNKMTHAFTPDRLEVLKLLTAQAAISIANARYHEVQMEAQQAKINPHFLFNALSSIADLTIADPKTAEVAVVKLSNLYRYILTSSGSMLVTLDQELEVVRTYLMLEKLRFGSRLEFAITTEGEAERVRLPGLMIQPLVENSIRHGLAPKMDKGAVSITARVEALRCRISVHDDGEPDSKPSSGTGFGLSSVRERLNLAFGDDYSLEIIRSKGFRVEIVIPILGAA